MNLYVTEISKDPYLTREVNILLYFKEDKWHLVSLTKNQISRLKYGRWGRDGISRNYFQSDRDSGVQRKRVGVSYEVQ